MSAIAEGLARLVCHGWFQAGFHFGLGLMMPALLTFAIALFIWSLVHDRRGEP